MKTELIFDLSSQGQNCYLVSEWEGDEISPIPQKHLRTDIPLPDCSEPAVIRHYNNLSRMNFGVDNGMYPLGSCTMKYNPKINERVAGLRGFMKLHPHTCSESVQGALRIMHELSGYLCALSGFGGVTLSPAAGSHGELTGVMIVKKYFETSGEQRNTVLIPDSAHGTNPASVAMCGFKVKEVPSTPDGDVDIAALEDMIDGDVAAMMLTCPNTLGFFDRNIQKISEILHRNGSLFYGDGANLNAIIGRSRFRDMGFDMMHINLHKTFSTPHGGGGPGAGPLAVTEELVKYLPVPQVKKTDDGYSLDNDCDESIGRISTFFGNFSVCVRAWVYINMLGYSGLRDVSDTAVLNANYVMSKLKDTFNLPVKRRCMHEFVMNDHGLPSGITTNDISKRILDYGFHSPTVYFPLLISGAMMIEPTECETLKSLDSFINAMKIIRSECDNEPGILHSAPVKTPVRRVDTVLAAKKPLLVWEGENAEKA